MGCCPDGPRMAIIYLLITGTHYSPDFPRGGMCPMMYRMVTTRVVRISDSKNKEHLKKHVFVFEYFKPVQIVC